MLTRPFTGVIAAPMLPMFEDGEIDWSTLERYIDWIASQKPAAIVMNVDASEVIALDDAEQLRIIEVCRTVVAGRVPLMSGVVAGSTRAAARKAQLLRDVGMLDKLYEATVNYFHQLELYIAAAAAKKEELGKSWDEMNAGLPGMVGAIQSRVDILSKARRLPSGLDKAAFENAKASLDTVNQTWSEATSAFSGGNLMEAVTKATAVKEKAAEIMTALGMQVPEAAAK